jgi:hypothetical protein
VDHLHIRQSKPYFFGDLVIEKDASGNEFADFKDNVVSQGDGLG